MIDLRVESAWSIFTYHAFHCYGAKWMTLSIFIKSDISFCEQTHNHRIEMQVSLDTTSRLRERDIQRETNTHRERGRERGREGWRERER